MTRLAAVLLMLAAASTAAAAEVRAYDVRVRVAGSGQADVDVVVRLEGAAAGTVVIPLGFATITELRLVEGPAGTTLDAQPAGTQTNLRIVFASVPLSPLSVSMAFRTDGLLSGGAGPGTPAMLTHALLNSQPDPIQAYTVRLVLPSGLRAHAVREALPKLGATEAGPRVELARVEGVNGAILRSGPLAQGDTASMQVETVAVARSPLWLLAGGLLSLLYLVSFRDLVTSPVTSEKRIP